MQHIIKSTTRASSSSLSRVTGARPFINSLVHPTRWNSSSSSKPPTETPNQTTTSQNQTQGRTLNPDWSAPVVTYEEVKARVRAPPPDEVAQGMIPTAVNIPLSGFIASIRSSPDEFRRLHGFTKPRPDQEIVFYCRSGRRSATAADSARDNGYTNIKNYSGSWLDWVKKTQENDYNL
ncbi:hypothetical protein PIIN_09286 [Serendipita indica DSM 11827]|uniref:Rhodanese domain-containing protein n=1 Tax=Serendipita indica (strain DSM 11827) TaxID=1109443 RepID=G4TVF8_SERID|nr:hypothetical protein PIIN_09286 [Serendipita indica DSM 11827]